MNQFNLMAHVCLICLRTLSDGRSVIYGNQQEKIKTNIYDVFWLPPLDKNVVRIISFNESV